MNERPTPETDAMMSTALTEPSEDSETVGDMTPYCVIELSRRLERERDDLRCQIAGRDTLTMWNYACGHIVRRKESDACPIYKEQNDLREKLRLANDDAERGWSWATTGDDNVVEQLLQQQLESHQARMKGTI